MVKCGTLGRLEYAQDLHAAESVYHQTCSVNFRTGKGIPKQFSSDYEKDAKKAKQGRPVDAVKNSAFAKVIQYLEANDGEQTTVSDLVQIMSEALDGTNEEPYSTVYMKTKLQEHFGDKILITSIYGKSNVVTFRQTAASVTDEFYCNPRPKDTEEERCRIIETSAKLIKSEIKNIDVSSDVYPTSAVISDVEEALKLIPDLLKSFLELLFVGKDIKLKLASVGQAIVQAVRPRVILAPLQLGLGVQMHHHFSSKFLIDSLNSHGFCASYKTVQKYKRSAAVAQGTEIPGYTPGQFVQYSADNVNHNLRTLDGTGTFHGMGIIASITPGTKATIPIPIRKVSVQDMAKVGRIEICPFIGPLENTPLHYQELQSITV